MLRLVTENKNVERIIQIKNVYIVRKEIEVYSQL